MGFPADRAILRHTSRRFRPLREEPIPPRRSSRDHPCRQSGARIPHAMLRPTGHLNLKTWMAPTSPSAARLPRGMPPRTQHDSQTNLLIRPGDCSPIQSLVGATNSDTLATIRTFVRMLVRETLPAMWACARLFHVRTLAQESTGCKTFFVPNPSTTIMDMTFAARQSGKSIPTLLGIRKSPGGLNSPVGSDPVDLDLRGQQ